MSRKGRQRARARRPSAPDRRPPDRASKSTVVERRDFARIFVGRFLFWTPSVLVVWFFVTPAYNLFLVHATEALLQVTESPDATRLTPYMKHHVVVTRADMPPSRGRLTTFKVTDVHFPLILLGAFFLAVPGRPLHKRLAPLGWALLIAAGVHLLTLFCQVKSFYANGLGEWSTAHYGELGQNFWGLSQHLLKIPVKLALPFALWTTFYLRLLLPEPAPGSEPRPPGA